MIEKIHVKQNFTVVPNAILHDPNLSLRAKGLYAYLCSKPGTWRFSMSRVEGSDGRAAIRSAMQELLQAGYVRRELIFNSKHQIIGYLYVVSENPSSENPSSENPSSENPSSENRTTEIALNPLADNEEPERYKKRIIKEGNNKKRDINNMIDRYKSNDSRIHEQEPTDIRKVLKQSQPSESNTRPYLVFESQIVRHLIELGFPRKSLRSEDDKKELDEILAKCDENVSVMLQKLETLAKERHIRLYEYGGKISLQKLRERWDDLTVEVQFSPEMADWHYREYAVYCIRNNYDDRQIVMMAKGLCYCYSLPRSEVYNVAKKLRQIIEELLLREKKRRENVRPNLGIDYGSLVQKFPT